MDNEIIFYIYIYIFIYNILNVILQLSVFTSWKLVSFRIITISYRNTLLGYCTTFYTHRLLFRNSLGMFRLSVTTTRLLKSHEIAHLSYRSIVTYEISCTVNLIATTIPFIRGHTHPFHSFTLVYPILLSPLISNLIFA